MFDKFVAYFCLECSTHVVSARSAIDQQLFEDVLDPVKCAEQLKIIKTNPSLTFQSKYKVVF